MLLSGATTANERATYGMAQEMALKTLRALLVDVPTEAGGQILVASETALGPVRDMFAN